ncbi:hypothetical protein M8818_006508 [Zalaria obscura]|uniref:Uncharacterized protein n=1 Tax=Zalaria obscura TaxID=2024903 RepID=A0ACC3S701_9PEZI
MDLTAVQHAQFGNHRQVRPRCLLLLTLPPNAPQNLCTAGSHHPANPSPSESLQWLFRKRPEQAWVAERCACTYQSPLGALVPLHRGHLMGLLCGLQGTPRLHQNPSDLSHFSATQNTSVRHDCSRKWYPTQVAYGRSTQWPIRCLPGRHS